MVTRNKSRYHALINALEHGTEHNDAKAQYCLGLAVDNNLLSKRNNLPKAADLYKMAGDKGWVGALFETLHQEILNNSNNAEDTLQRATKILIKKVDRGSLQALYSLAFLYFITGSTDKQKNAAFKYCRTAAKKGHKDAQFLLATMYGKGYGTKVEQEKQALWLEKAAKKEHPEACFALYQLIMGKKFNIADRTVEETQNLLLKSAELGHADAQFFLGQDLFNRYVKGDTKVNIDMLFWLLKAAEQKHSNALEKLSAIYYDGIGVTQDLEHSAKFALKAANATRDITLKNIHLPNGVTIKKEQNKIQKYLAHYLDVLDPNYKGTTNHKEKDLKIFWQVA